MIKQLTSFEVLFLFKHENATFGTENDVNFKIIYEKNLSHRISDATFSSGNNLFAMSILHISLVACTIHLVALREQSNFFQRFILSCLCSISSTELYTHLYM